jgi:hypothetical protein
MVSNVKGGIDLRANKKRDSGQNAILWLKIAYTYNDYIMLNLQYYLLLKMKCKGGISIAVT